MLTKLWRRLRQQDRVEELERENSELVKVLGWYALRSNWYEGTYNRSMALWDKGQRARAILDEEEES